MIYLDNNATTGVEERVLAGMLPYLKGAYGNPSSVHRFGQEARQAVEHARHQVAGLIGCDVRELIFTSGGTESDNAAIRGLLAARTAGGAERKVIVTSAVEHSAVHEPLEGLKKNGFEVIEIPVTQSGGLQMEMLESLLKSRANEIALASIMWANNETGVVFDVERIGTLCREVSVPLHVDGVQATGKLAVNVKALSIDAMSVSAHKFHGPKGVGALYVRRGVRWQPWVRGGPQERDRRGGTENVPGIVGMGIAAEIVKEFVSSGGWESVRALRDRLERGILETMSETSVNGGEEVRVPNTTNVSFAGLEAEAILLLLSEQDLCASAGAACSSGSLEPSRVIRAMALPDRVAHGAVRFSLSKWTTEAEVDAALGIIPGVIERLRKTMPV